MGICKKNLWKIFAYHIKKLYEAEGYIPCYTCGRAMVIGTSNCQAGHWLTKKGYPYHYFNPDNVRPQCYHCNINLSGNSEVFRRNLENEIGKEAVDEMYRTRQWYIDKISKFSGGS